MENARLIAKALMVTHCPGSEARDRRGGVLKRLKFSLSNRDRGVAKFKKFLQNRG